MSNTTIMDEFVDAKTTITDLSFGKKYNFQPGNGWKYELLVIRVNSHLELGQLGGIESGWLVVNGLTQMSYLFSSHEKFLASSYVAEKLFPLTKQIDMHVSSVTALLGTILGGDTDVDIWSQLGIRI